MTPLARRAGALICASLGPIFCGLHAQSAHAVTPSSPEVRDVLDKAFGYLKSATDARLGGKCLIGLAFVKDGADETHPRVKEGVDACVAAARRDANQINADIYSTGLAVMDCVVRRLTGSAGSR